MSSRTSFPSAAVLVLLVAGVGAALVVAQAGGAGVLSSAIRSVDWGLDDWAAIRRGQLSISHEPGGDRLNVLALSVLAVPAAPGKVRSATPACDGNCYVVTTFDYGNANALGGRFSAFAAAPSAARAALHTIDDGRRAMTIDFSKASTGVCGAWVHLFDFTRSAADRTYLDATPFSVLTFWIRSLSGRERVALKAADAAWAGKEDALPLGDVASFVPSGRLDTTWQRAVVPLSSLPGGLRPGELAVLVFEATAGGDGQVAIKDLAFCLKDAPLPALSAPPAPAPRRPAPAKALWVWNTARILTDDEAQRALLEFCARTSFTDLFLQLPNDAAHLGPSDEVVLEAGRWAPFLARVTHAGIRPHALDGDRHFALPEYHDRVLRTIDNIVRYNASADAGTRFAGVHYDIEPYLLPGFQGPRRARIVSDYLALVAAVASRARAAGLTVGVDIPFWYDSPGELDGQRLLVDYHGRRKPASEHVLDLVDHVGLMDYRTAAYGADGFLGHAEGELQYASAAGKRVFVGLETTDLPDEELVEFSGRPGLGLPSPAPAQRWVVLEESPEGATVWLVPPGALPDTPSSGRRRGGTTIWWPASRVVPVPSAKLSFARLGAEALHDAMRDAADDLQRYPSFAGYAIHDYLGYRALLGASRPGR
jgi:hypothetical protein